MLDRKVVIDIDGYLEPNATAIVERHDAFRHWKDRIEHFEGSYDNFTKGYDKFGFNVNSNGDVVYNEWAPNAKEAYLIGDFSEQSSLITLRVTVLIGCLDDWNRTSHPMKKDQFGVWNITVPAKSGVCAIPHDSKLKVGWHCIPELVLVSYYHFDSRFPWYYPQENVSSVYPPG